MTTAAATYAPPVAEIDRPRSRALMAGGIGLALCAVGFFVDPQQFYRSWLIAYQLFLGLALGSMAMVMIQHLSGGQWGVFRRIFEAGSRTLPLLIVLFVPVLLGMTTLYPWTHADHVAADEAMRHKAPYMNTPMFIVRAAVYFVGWWAIATFLNKWSEQQDRGDVSVNTRLQRLSGGGLVFYALTVTSAAIDWMMSLNPHWYSTMFGFLIMGGQGVGALSLAIIVGTFLVEREPMDEVFKPNHFHDLGKLLFAFIMLWTYFAFSQYLLVFSANLIEEIPYIITRTNNGWQYLALFVVTFHFAVPWLLLLSRDRKRNPHRLVLVALWMLLMRFFDIFLMVSPEFASTGGNLHLLEGEPVSHFFFHWLDVAAPLAIGGLWVWMFLTELRQRPLLATGDPYLRQSLETAGGH